MSVESKPRCLCAICPGAGGFMGAYWPHASVDAGQRPVDSVDPEGSCQRLIIPI